MEGGWTKEEVGAWLKALREATRCSHDQIGARASKSRQQLISYEKGTHEPKAAAFLDLLGVMGVNVNALGVTRPPTITEIGGKLDGALILLAASLRPEDAQFAAAVDAIVEGELRRLTERGPREDEGPA